MLHCASKLKGQLKTSCCLHATEVVNCCNLDCYENKFLRVKSSVDCDAIKIKVVKASKLLQTSC